MNDDDARTLVRACLVEFGMDVSDPIELQKDLAFLRNHRLTDEKLGLAGKIAALTIFLTGITSMIWIGVQASIGIGK